MTERIRIRYSETDASGKLSMQGLLRLFQDMNYLGAEDAGRGITYQNAHGAAWYLLSWDIHTVSMPSLSETVTFTSHFYQSTGPLAKKFMNLTNENGEVLAYALTRWAYVNKESGEPMPFPPDYWQGEPTLPLPAGYTETTRLRAPTNAELLAPITVSLDLIDENRHVNNVRFSEMALDMMGYRYGAVTLRAVFVRQTRLGDILTPRLAKGTDAGTIAFFGEDGLVNAVFYAN